MTEATKALVQECLTERDAVPTAEDTEFAEVVARLSRAGEDETADQRPRGGARALPSRAAIVETVESLRSVLFPEFFGLSSGSDRIRFQVGTALDHALRLLGEQLNVVLGYHQDQDAHRRALRERCVRDISRGLLRQLPRVQELLLADAQAALTGDPAATGLAEIVLCYPGLVAITNYRLAHELYKLGVPVISRIITEHAHGVTGIDIHPGAQIGRSFFIDHGTGVVIGETTIIGDRVRIYHGVTLGAKSFRTDEHGALVKGTPRHPVVEDDVVIYAGATVLGRITIGRGSTIGGNVWLTRSVAPGSLITQGRPVEERDAPADGV